MKLIVKVLHGDECVLDVSGDTSVSEVKLLVEKKLNIPIAQQKLLYTGKILSDERKLEEFSLKDGAKIVVTVKKRDDPGTANSTGEVTVLWDAMYRFLRKYYSDSDSKKVLHEFKKEFETSVSSLSLDDLERIATSYLQEQK